MLTKDKAAGLGTAAASISDYTRNYSIPAATLLTRLSAEPAPDDPAPEAEPTPEPEPEPVHYSRGTHKFDAYPAQRSAASFEAFAEAVLLDRSTAKGLTWISGPFARNDDGRHHRCGDGLQPRRFLANDLDGATPEAFVDLGMWLGAYSGFGYTTASHTTENPHARFILELSRPVSRAEGIRLGEAMQRQIEARMGPGAVKLDPSVYRGEQPIYGPLCGAETMHYYGDPVDVDQILKDAPPLEERPGRAERAPFWAPAGTLGARAASGRARTTCCRRSARGGSGLPSRCASP